MQANASRISAPTQGRPLPIGDHFFAHSFRARDFGGLMEPVLMVDHFWMRKDSRGRGARPFRADRRRAFHGVIYS